MNKKIEGIMVNIDTIHPNKKKLEMYQTPENYDNIKQNIEQEGIIEPLLVNEETHEIISGNLRFQVAKDLGITLVPVIFQNIDQEEMDIISISTNQQRKKSYSEILKELNFFEEHYKIKKGQRTDLNPDLKNLKEKRDKFMKAVPRDTRDKLKAVDKMASELFGKESKQYKNVFTSLDKHKTTLNGQFQSLTDKTRRKHNDSIIPKKYEIKSNWTTIYQKSSEDMSEIESGTINSIITSPPYFQMRDYGIGNEQIGMEDSIEKYLDNLMAIFRECHRVLRDDGSCFVNINDCVIDGKYQAVPHKFLLRMLDLGFRFNDELLWIKVNPQYTRGPRSVRGHEPIYHFVKSENFYYNDEWLKDLDDPQKQVSYGAGKIDPKVISYLDYRDGVLKTKASNTADLRKESKDKRGFHLTHSATFPIDVPSICALLTTREEDTILDPFSGTAVTGEYARRNARYYIGYELNPEFALASEVRLIKIPPPGFIDEQEERDKLLKKKVYPKWEKEKKNGKIEYHPPKEMFTPEQKAHWKKVKHKLQKPK
ncbi:MAG: ParB N-terminal domain-containing protein [Bacteroidales bacterium]|nr:ParB N-terminal domain-containing protein [Bacteroidales bacterium]